MPIAFSSGTQRSYSFAAHVADSIENARLVTVPNAAHLPSLERSEKVNALLLDFLSS